MTISLSLSVDPNWIGEHGAFRGSQRADAYMTGAINDLTEGQKACLRLFYQRYDAKEIARQLQIAPSTVHQRLTAARKLLGVTRSMEAARLLAQSENRLAEGTYDPVLYDGIDIAGSPEIASSGGAPWLPVPWPTRGRPTNDLSFAQKLVAIVGLAIAFMLAVFLYLIAVRELGEIL